MARIPQQQSQPDDLAQLLGLAQLNEAISKPPPMEDIIRLLGVAGNLQNQEQENLVRQQAVAVEQEKARIEQQKLNQLSPEMYTLLAMGATPEQVATMKNRARPDVFQAPAPGEKLPEPTPTGPEKPKPAKRKPVKSAEAFLGYAPPQGEFEAALDENGNILNFVKAGSREPYAGDFVPSMESYSPWATYKYGVAQKLNALGRTIGLLPQPGPTQPY